MDALHRAARSGDWGAMDKFLAAGADVNVLDDDALTTLFYVCAQDEPGRAKRLIDAGAAADVAGQSLSPLWAAATLGDEELVRLLLDAGANVPLDPLDADLTMMSGKSPSIAHPAVAAIRSGSVAVLKQLVAAAPDLDLDRLYGSDFPDPAEIDATGRPSPDPYPVWDAVRARHPEMAEYLIRRGCRIEGAESSDLDRPYFGSHTLMISAIMGTPPMPGVVAALRERGVPMIRPPALQWWHALIPWDGLSAAVRSGNLTLASELLPAVGEPAEGQFMALLMLAEASGNDEMVQRVHETFPDGKLPRTTPEENERALEKVRMVRTFTPRLKAPPTPRGPITGLREEVVLAVLAQEEAQGVAAVLVARASLEKGWSVVEREEIESLLKERDFQPWNDTSVNLFAVGDQLSANVLVIVSKIGGEKEGVLRFEAVDVASGMVIDRRHLQENDFDGAEFADRYLPAIRSELAHHHEKGALTAVTVLPVGADARLPHGRGLASLVRGGLMQEIDATPGMISLTREQMTAVAEEHVRRELGSLWGAGWTVEGGIDALDDDRIRLGLRLRPTIGSAIGHDVFAEGTEDELPMLVTAAWRDLLRQIGDRTIEGPGGAKDQEARRAAEAERLLREAEWLTNLYRADEAVPLIDAAVHLGADPIRALPQRAHIHAFQARLQWRGDSNKRPRHSQIGDGMTHMLPHNLSRLGVVHECFVRYRAALAEAGFAERPSDEKFQQLRNDPYKEFWILLRHFVTYRAILQPNRMNGEQRELMRQFDEELGTYLKALFATAAGRNGMQNLLEHASHFWAPDYEAVPDLAPSLAAALVRCWDHVHLRQMDMFVPKFVANSPWAEAPDFRDRRSGTSHATRAGVDPDRSVKLIAALEAEVAKQNVRHRDLRLAELAFLRSSGSDRAVTARAVVEQWAEILMTDEDLLEGRNFPKLVPHDQLARYIPVIGPVSFPDNWYHWLPVLSHGSALLPERVSQGGVVPDVHLRPAHYEVVRFAWLSVKNGIVKKQRLRNKYADELDRVLKPIIGRKDATAAALLVEGAGLYDEIFGFDLEKEFRAQLDELETDTRERVGSRNQFVVIDFPNALRPKLLADVRPADGSPSSKITHHLIDPTNKNVLWLVVRPLMDPEFVIHREYLTPGSTFSSGHPRLLALDCVSGHVLHDINLAKLPGLWPGESPATWVTNDLNLGLWEDRFFYPALIANDTHLLMQFGAGFGRGYVETLVSIDRATGEVERLPQELGRVEGIDSGPAAVGLGDSFYIVTDGDGRRGDDRSKFDGQALWRIRAGQPPVLLSRSGRRPAVSPFDAADRPITHLWLDQGKLLLRSEDELHAFYDPADDSWQEDPLGAGIEKHVRNLERSIFHRTLFPHHVITLKDGSKRWFGNARDAKAGLLNFDDEKNRHHDLPLTLRIPDDFDTRYRVYSRIADHTVPQVELDREGFEWLEASDLTRTPMMVPQILNQTDSHFILGLRFASSLRWENGIDDARMPFVWAVGKEEVEAAIERIEKGK